MAMTRDDHDRGSRWQRFAGRLQQIDQRVIYGVLVVVTVVAFAVTPMPVTHVGPETIDAFEAVDSCPKDKVVLVDSSWEMWTQAENRAQFLALIEHLFRANIKFVVTSVGIAPFGPKMAQDRIGPLAEKYGKRYGVDYVNLGFKPAGGSAIVSAPLGFLLDAFARDIHGIYPTDMSGTPVSELPIMEGVKRIQDIHLVVCIGYEPAQEWISFIRGQYGTPVIWSCMSIVVPIYAPYYESKQIAGIIGGTRGAAEYEQLLHERYPVPGEKAGEGMQLMTPQSFAHVLIILFIIVGNIGYFSSVRRKN